MTTTPKILLIDDNPDDRALVERELRQVIEGVRVTHIGDPQALDAAIAEGNFDVAITDYHLRWTTGTEILHRLKQRYPGRPVIMFTGSGNEEIAVNAMKEGLDDYITKTVKHYPRVPYAVLACFDRATKRDQLQQQREELQAILDVLPVGVAISYDPLVEQVTLTPYCAQMLGLNVASTYILDFQNGEEIPFTFYRDGKPLEPQALPMQQAARTGANIRDEELEVQQASGNRIHVLVNAVPMRDRHGEVRGAVGALVNITALKKIQQELEKADRQKNEFLSVLAHELRNPMAAIGYAVGLLQHGMAPDAISKARDVIGRQTAHMGKLLDDLLDLSRITRNSIEIARQPLDLREVIALGLESVKPLIDEYGHTVVSDMPPEPIPVSGDEVRLTQVVSNILNNAAKFTPRHGKIEIRARQSGRAAVIDVIDNGTGIAAEKLEYVFEMFSQAQSKASGGTSGLGIGLAIVRKFVELHGGSVQAFSDGIGQGSRIHIELPLAESAVSDNSLSRQKPAPASAQLQLLVADDNVDAANTLSEILRVQGYAVQTVFDGRAAIEFAKTSPPDAAILDIGMPFATGHEVAQWIRQQDWGNKVMLIAVTGWGQAEDKSAALQAGFDMHFVKPVDAFEIAHAIADQLK